MASLLKMASDDLINMFIYTVKSKAKNTDDKKYFYRLHCDPSFNNYYKINLNQLIFIANNNYHLWLIVYHYLLENVSSKQILITGEDDESNDFQVFKEVVRNPLDMADENLLREFIFDMIKNENDNITMSQVVDEFVEDFFRNDHFWAKKLKDKTITLDFTTEQFDYEDGNAIMDANDLKEDE